MPRLFVAVWPPPEVMAALRAMSRPALPGGRWTREEQWHVTLRFLGTVEDAAVAHLSSALGRACAELAPAPVTMASPARCFGAAVALPVAGLERVGSAVVAATADFGRPPEPRPFHGHLTVARLGRRGRGRVAVDGRVAVSWTVRDVCLVESRLGKGAGGTAHYEDVSVHQLGGHGA